MGRRYRRRSHANQIISDSVFIVSRLSWYGAFLYGLITFLLFYYAVPYWLSSVHATQVGTSINQGLEVINHRWIRVFHYVGIACGVAGLLFTVRNYFVLPTAQRNERSFAGLLARFLGHHWD
ncbi:hypothetical protein [Shewanella sp. SM96]|uniref:Uncharacterized protein n=1 Tax=Shewanella putrefaciens (strain 200) TaxID=399804 RepID=E6XKB7_SHEP2|nr:hypothetical protein [Shewanella sp. SM96]MCU8004136.1 hypothetical protein [Shewanella sp. SM96]SUI78388.1 Uncharacterised protein [Shewanella baltica]